MARASSRVAVWGAGSPLSTGLAERLRRHELETTCIAGLSARPGAAHRTVVFPVWDGRPAEDAPARRARLLAETATLLAALDDGRLSRLVVISTAGVYGSPASTGSTAAGNIAESSPPEAPEGDTPASDAAAVERLAATGAGGVDGGRPGLAVLRPAFLLGPGCETGLLARHLAGPRLLVVRGSAPRWQVCHLDDLASAVALLLGLEDSELPPPAVVASSGVLDQAALEAASGRRRLELPARVAEATAARLRRTRLSPAAPDELQLLTHPVVVTATLLAGLGFVPGREAAWAVRDQLGLAPDGPDGQGTATTPGGYDGQPDGVPNGGPGGGPVSGQVAPSEGRSGTQQAKTLAGATVAVVGSAALLRSARRQRGRRAG